MVSNIDTNAMYYIVLFSIYIYYNMYIVKEDSHKRCYAIKMEMIYYYVSVECFSYYEEHIIDENEFRYSIELLMNDKEQFKKHILSIVSNIYKSENRDLENFEEYQYSMGAKYE